MLQDADAEINGGQNSDISNLESDLFQVQLPVPPTLSSESNRRGTVSKKKLVNMSNVSYGSLKGHARRVTASTAQIKKNITKVHTQKNRNKKISSVCVNTSSVCTNTSGVCVNTKLKKNYSY